MSTARRTVLYSQHQAAGARFTEFAGWEMPVQYQGVISESQAVRTKTGLFDISHMGEFLVSGAEAARWLDRMLTARISAREPGAATYCLLLNEQGGVIDDLITYQVTSTDFLLVVNASKIEEDARWFRDHLADSISFSDASGFFSALAVQGPDSPALYEKIFGERLPSARNRVACLPGSKQQAWVCTTGYTGELGFEIVCRNSLVTRFWELFTEAGCQPCGLGARDVLRLEMGYPLNGADLDPQHTPLEARLGFAVDLSKPDFIGREALIRQKNEGIPTRLCGLKLDQPMPPLRAHYPVLHEGIKVSETTSGGLSPTLQSPIGMAYLPAALSVPGTALEIEIRGRLHPAHVSKKPFLPTTSLSKTNHL